MYFILFLIPGIGRVNVSKTINNILKFIIAHELALNVRYTATTGKYAFGGTLLAQLVMGTYTVYVLL